MATQIEEAEKIAQMIARGVPPAKAAAACGVAAQALRAVVESPLLKALVEKYQAEQLKSIEDQVQDKLDAAMPDLIDAVIALAKNAKAEATRLRAAELCAKWSSRVKTEEVKEVPQLTIVIEGDAAVRLKALDEKLSAIDVTPTQL